MKRIINRSSIGSSGIEHEGCYYWTEMFQDIVGKNILFIINPDNEQQIFVWTTGGIYLGSAFLIPSSNEEGATHAH